MVSIVSIVGSYLKRRSGLPMRRLYPSFELKSKALDLKGRDSGLSKSSFYKRWACQGIYHSWSYAAFEEVAELKKPFVLEEMPGYRPSSKEEAAAVEEATVTSIEAFVFKGFVEMPYV
nr:hypothetical protein [Tanacetum cinerariifolium]